MTIEHNTGTLCVLFGTLTWALCACSNGDETTDAGPADANTYDAAVDVDAWSSDTSSSSDGNIAQDGPKSETGIAVDDGPRDGSLGDGPVSHPDALIVSDTQPSIPNFLISAVKPTDILVDETSVYWLERETGRVGVASKDGKNSTYIATSQGSPIVIAQDQTHIYWANRLFEGGIWRYKKGAGPVEKFVSASGPTGLTVDEASVYWLEADTGLWRASKATAVAEKIQTAPLGLDGNRRQSIAVKNGFVYFAQFRSLGVGNTLVRVPVVGGTVTELPGRVFDDGQRENRIYPSDWIVAEGNKVFSAGYAKDGRLYEYDVVTGVTLLRSFWFNIAPLDVAARGDRVFFTLTDRLYKLSGNSTLTPSNAVLITNIARSTGEADWGALAIDETHVYWCDTNFIGRTAD